MGKKIGAGASAHSVALPAGAESLFYTWRNSDHEAEVELEPVDFSIQNAFSILLRRSLSIFPLSFFSLSLLRC